MTTSSVITNSKILMKSNKRLLLYVLIVAFICSFISLFLQRNNNNLLILVIIFIINIIFQFGMNYIYTKIVKGEKYNYKDIFHLRKYSLKIFVLSIIYIIVIALGLFILNIIISIPYVIIAIPGLIFLSVVLLNILNHLLIFNILENDDSILKIVRNSYKYILEYKKLFIYIIFQVLKFVIIGSVLVICLNIFVYSLQINEALSAGSVVNELKIDEIFSTNLSFLIQSIGMQIVVGYITIMTGITYCTLFFSDIK